MSTYRDQIDSAFRICPYCKDEYRVECEDYSEDIRVEECENCGKKFHTYESYSIDHWTKPDCSINGEEHVWVDRDLGNGRTHPFCDVCDKCKSFRDMP